jgi:hypothetical protein
MKKLLLFLACLIMLGCAEEPRCHRSHLVERYHTGQVVAQKIGDVTIFLPAPTSCSLERVCDVKCLELDAGKMERHPNHPEQIGDIVLNPSCAAYRGRP